MKIEKLSIVIPAYNEERTIIELLNTVMGVDLGDVAKEVIVVDDGSKDRTRDLLKEYAKSNPIRLILHEKNTGKGGAVRNGFGVATGDFAVVQDADLEYDPNDFKKMLACAEKNNAEAVFGSRTLGMKSGISKRGSLGFFIGGLGVTLATNLIYGIWLTDEPTCYKMVKRSLIDKLGLESTGFEFCPEITAKISKKGVHIYEVPIRYIPRTTKEGKKIKFRDGIIAIWTLLKYRI